MKRENQIGWIAICGTFLLYPILPQYIYIFKGLNIVNFCGALTIIGVIIGGVIYKCKIPYLIFPYILYATYYSISYCAEGAWLSALSLAMMMVVIPLLSVGFVNTNRRFETAINLLIDGGFILSLLGIVESITKINLFQLFSNANGLTFFHEVRYGFLRIMGTFGQPISYGLYHVFIIALIIYIIMDYSIHDAIEAGFNHVVFIIRKDIEKEFKEVIGDRIDSICSSHNVTVDYAFQDINDIPGTMPEGRTKPWGTGQAVLAAKNVIDTPFIVINADDYYGKEGFKAVHEYLVNGGKSCMAGFVLKNTLSDNGGVTRGICKMDDQNNLTEVVETKNIVKTATGAEADGVAVDVNSLVSMNMWGLTPEFLDVLEGGFKEFFKKEVPGNPLKAEYLIPIFIGELLEQGKMSVKVLRTNDTWYGMTYHEDVAAVKDSFKKMLENGVYKADLFSDL